MSSESRHATVQTGERPRFVDPSDAFDAVHEVVGRKWNLRIVYHLLQRGPLGFSDLKSRLEGVSSKMLSESLSALESSDIVAREVVSEQPFRVEYSLTERGRALEPTVEDLLAWDAQHTEGR